MDNLIFVAADSEIVAQDFDNFTLVKLQEDLSKGVDQWMTGIIHRNLQESTYVNIYLPICYGKILSDFLGLRLSLHIRMTKSKNTLANIFLYGTENIATLYKTDFSEVLKTRGVFLVDYNMHAIKSSVLSKQTLRTNEDLISELNKITIKMPAHLYDNHSVANIWGLYRLLELSSISPTDIQSLLSARNDLNNIYFKWLVSKNTSQELVTEEISEKRRQYAITLAGPKIVGKIDLPSEKKKKK